MKTYKNKLHKNTNSDYSIPGISLTEAKRELKILGYLDEETSQKEEEEYNNMETASYFARLDVDILYNTQKYYKRIYITDDSVTYEEEKGAYNSLGVYLTPNELRGMNMEGLIVKEYKDVGVHKEYNNELALIHWTAPLANLYYDKINNTKIINDYTYSAMLRRNFEFNPLVYYNTYIAGNSFYKDGTFDEFLIKVLLSKKEARDLTDIIYSIQSNQNHIIRTDSRENFIVQGCAGSGKTMILLHRLSYLKFNNLLPQYDKIKIITPNNLFCNFIKNLTNKLKINEIEQVTIDRYFISINDKYIKKYEKRDEISNDFFDNKREKYKSRFDNKNYLEENISLNKNIKYIYNSIYVLVQNEYNAIMNNAKKLLVQNNIEYNNHFNNNKINIEVSIRNINNKIKAIEEKADRNISIIHRKIEETNHTIYTIKKQDFIQKKLEINNRINDIEAKISHFLKENLIEFPKRNDSYDKVFKDILNVKNTIKNLEDDKTQKLISINENNKIINSLINKIEELKKINFSFKINSSIKQYKRILKNKENEIKKLKEEQANISENLNKYIAKQDLLDNKINYYKKVRLEVNIQNLKNELEKIDKLNEEKEKKILENVDLLKKLNEELKNTRTTYAKEKNNLTTLKNTIISNYYFSIDMYDVIREKIHEKFEIKIQKNQFYKFDILILVIINYLHMNAIINGDQLLCIDEAQDYSLNELKILSKVNNKANLNLYGDINQAIYQQGIYSWNKLIEELNLKYYELNENYRNSIEVTKFCNKQFHFKIKEMGLKIKDVQYITGKEIPEIINEKISNNKSIAIISKNVLKSDNNNPLVHYCSIQDAKGIEYNTVIVNETDMSENEKYIAYTRALSELYIIV